MAALALGEHFLPGEGKRLPSAKGAQNFSGNFKYCKQRKNN
jgi:hypothetical protein